MAKTRLPLVDRSDDPEIAAMFERPMVSPVPTPNVLRLLANHPELLKRFTGFAAVFAKLTTLPRRDVEIVILRTAWRAQNEYEFAQHRDRAIASGLTPAQVAELCTEAPGWSGRDGALVGLVDELHRDAVASDPTWRALRSTYDDRQVIELMLLPGFYRMLAGLLGTVELPVDEGLPRWPETTARP